MYEANIIDAICGIGKTSGAINMINQSDDEVRYLYITPFLSEVKRVKTECKKKNFKEPKVMGTKIEGIKYLFSKRYNIVSTHALFRMFDQQTIEISNLNNYTLIMDEVSEVIEVLDITKKDLNNILNNYAHVNDDGVLVWHDGDYKGKYDEYKRLCDLGCISIYGSEEAPVALLWMFPINIFKAFKKIYILTYMFNGQLQKYYFDHYGVKCNNLYIKDFQITEEKQDYDLGYIRDLIKICDNERMNAIGSNKLSNRTDRFDTALSSTWYGENGHLLRILKDNCINFFYHIAKTKSHDNLWTTYKEFELDIKGNGYAKGFLSLNARATNDYRHKKSVAYLVNRFFNPLVKNFFTKRDIEVNEDMFALSELIQFLFRSRIRDKEEIDLYIPSARMRKILENWLETL